MTMQNFTSAKALVVIMAKMAIAIGINNMAKLGIQLKSMTKTLTGVKLI